MPSHGQYTIEKVTYPSHGEIIAAAPFRPKNMSNPPGVVIMGPYSFIKEKAPFQYGIHLADEGYVALIFDPLTVGESTDVALYDHRVLGVASVTGYYRDHETDLYMICAGCVSVEPGADISSLKMPTPEQGEALYQARLERAREAKRLYDTTGEIMYQPLGDPKAVDPIMGSLAGLPGPVVWSWYSPWTLKGYENRYAVMSDRDHFGYLTFSGVSQLKKPALIIHRDNCMNAAGAK